MLRPTNGVQFFIAPVASWLRTRRFSEPTFRPSGATNHWKNTVFRDFPTFSRICIFCLLALSLLIFSLLIFLFSLPLPCSAFHLSILSEVWLLNFLRLWYIMIYCDMLWYYYDILWSWSWHQFRSELPSHATTENVSMPGKHCVFGELVEGQATLDWATDKWSDCQPKRSSKHCIQRGASTRYCIYLLIRIFIIIYIIYI